MAKRALIAVYLDKVCLKVGKERLSYFRVMWQPYDKAKEILAFLSTTLFVSNSN